jgi:hypothetical protein
VFASNELPSLPVMADLRKAIGQEAGDTVAVSEEQMDR